MLLKSDSVLVKAAKEGDADSFAQLCSRYYTAMVAIAHSVLGDRHLAEDAAQQAFAKAVRNLHQLRDGSRFGSWLAVICRNTAKDAAKQDEKFFLGKDLTLVSAESRQGRLDEAVREAIEGLSEQLREIIFLRYYDGMSYRRISSVLGISKDAINGRLRRAKEKIGEYLRDKGFVEEGL